MSTVSHLTLSIKLKSLAKTHTNMRFVLLFSSDRLFLKIFVIRIDGF
jgi:hypothetical protein